MRKPVVYRVVCEACKSVSLLSYDELYKLSGNYLLRCAYCKHLIRTETLTEKAGD